jgi:hypothetical protein
MGPVNQDIQKKYDRYENTRKGLEHIAEENSLATPTMHGRNCGLHIRTLLLIFAFTHNVG